MSDMFANLYALGMIAGAILVAIVGNWILGKDD